MREFKLDKDAAADLLLVSADLIRDEVYLVDKPMKTLAYSSIPETDSPA